MRPVRYLAWGLALAVLAWLGLVMVAPFLPATLAGPLYLFASLLCHQRAERSFHWGASQWLVCARCTGLYAGGAIGALIWIARPIKAARTFPLEMSDRPYSVGWIAAVLAAPTIATVVVEWVLWNPGNLTRALAAAPLGAVIVLLPLRRVRFPGHGPRT